MNKNILLLLICLVGCTYKQPPINEPYSQIKAIHYAHITHIDGVPVFTLKDATLFRVTPGEHRVTLSYGHEEDDNFRGEVSKKDATITVEAQEGMCHYIGIKQKYDKTSLLGTVGFETPGSWRPKLYGKVPIKNYPFQQKSDAAH